MCYHQSGAVLCCNLLTGVTMDGWEWTEDWACHLEYDVGSTRWHSQSGHCTNLLTSLAMSGNQKQSFSSKRVLLASGWPVLRDECMEWISGVRWEQGTYWRPSGLPGEVASETLEEVGWSWDHWMGFTNRVEGKMGSGSSVASSRV